MLIDRMSNDVRDDECTMSVHRAVASKSDDVATSKSDDERHSSSLIVAHAYEASSAHIHAHARERLAFISSHMLATALHSTFIYRSSRCAACAPIYARPRAAAEAFAFILLG